MRALLARPRADRSALDAYAYDRVDVREELDGRGRVRRRQERRYEVFHAGGRPLARLVAEDGRPLSAGRQAREDRRVRELAEAVRQGRSASEDAGVHLAALAARHVFRHAGRDVHDGRPVVVLDFAPRAGAPGTVLAGRVWVDEGRGQVVRAEMLGAAGLGRAAVSVREAAVVLEYRNVDGAVWLPWRREVRAAGRAFLVRAFRLRETSTAERFRRFDVELREAARP